MTRCKHVCKKFRADDCLISAVKRCLPLFFFCFFDVIRVGLLFFVSSKRKVKYRFLLPLQKHKLHFKKKNLLNSNYKEHIPGTWIIQSLSVHNEPDRVEDLFENMLHNNQQDRMLILADQPWGSQSRDTWEWLLVISGKQWLLKYRTEEKDVYTPSCRR